MDFSFLKEFPYLNALIFIIITVGLAAITMIISYLLGPSRISKQKISLMNVALILQKQGKRNLL